MHEYRRTCNAAHQKNNLGPTIYDVMHVCCSELLHQHVDSQLVARYAGCLASLSGHTYQWTEDAQFTTLTGRC